MKEKTKVILSVSFAAAVLLAAMLLPLAFRPDSEGGALSAQQRTEMFLSCWEDDSEGLEVIKLSDTQRDDEQRCLESFSRLAGMYLPDRAIEHTTPTGSEYVVLRGKTGELKLCRMWLSEKGDWQNWIDMYINAETGELYYLYASCQCLKHGRDYADAFDGGLSAEKAAEIAADYGGESLKLSAEGGDAYRAFFLKDGDIICREARCEYYAGTVLELSLCVR